MLSRTLLSRTLRALLLCVALAAPLGWLYAAVNPETVALDQARQAMAGGDDRVAIRILTNALPKIKDEDGLARTRCLLGEALLRNGEPKPAERVLAEVPLERPCGRRAAFLHADALAAQGRVDEASARYEAIGSVAMGADRDGHTAEGIARLARRLLADPERGRAGLPLIEAVLGLQIGDERARDLAVTFADAATQPGGWPERTSDPACQALLRVLDTAEPAADLWQHAARVCPYSDARHLVASMPEGADARWMSAYLTRGDPDVSRWLALQSLEATPDPLRRWATATQLATMADLRAVPLLEADGRPDAWVILLGLFRQAGDLTQALQHATRHLAAHPTDPQRATVAELRAAISHEVARAAFARGDLTAARTGYDAIVAAHSDSHEAPRAAYEAGLVDRASKDPAAAKRRWEEVIARWPGTSPAEQAVAALARQQAFDEGRPEAARDFLRRSAASGAAWEFERMAEPALWIASSGRRFRDPQIRVGARNVPKVEVRLHEIDLEAYVRSGSELEDLPNLDVAAVAPDKTLQVDVPKHEPFRDIAFDLPLPKLSPGLYAVTVASETEEAKALLLVSDLSVVVRTVGSDLAVATFDGSGRPVGGARVVIVGTSTEGRTDASGLWRATSDLRGDTVVLAERDGSWAVTTVEMMGSTAQPALHVDGELERRAVLPGDVIGVRAMAREADGSPRKGEWVLWVSGGPQVTMASDREGLVVADLDVPPTARTQYIDGRPRSIPLEVMAVPPGEAGPRVIGTLRVVPEDRGGRTLQSQMVGDKAEFTVRGADSEPVADVAIRIDGGPVVRTDATGVASFKGPHTGLPWRVTASLAGSGVHTTATRLSSYPFRPQITLSAAHLRPNQRGTLSLALLDDEDVPRAGAAAVLLARVSPTPDAEKAPADPWVETPEVGIGGWKNWTGAAPELPAHALAPVWSEEIAIDGLTVVTLPALLEGDYVLTAIADGTAARSTSVPLRVTAAGLRVVGGRPTGLGDVLALGVEGTAALMTAESDRILFAAVRKPGQRTDVPVDRNWREEVVLAATSPDGQVDVHTVTADPTLDVTLKTDASGVTATVRDRAGRPVQASVSFAAWDTVVQHALGSPDALTEGFVEQYGLPAGAIGADLWDAHLGEPIAPALLAEVEREKERQKALSASASGILSDNRLAEVLMQDLPLGTTGMAGGIGGGGMGMGIGGIGSKGEGHGSGGGTSRGLTLHGFRERALWQVAQTDRSGQVRVPFTAQSARFRVRATAVTLQGMGNAEVTEDRSRSVRLIVRMPAAGWPGDTAQPRVSILNGTDEAVSGPLTMGEATVAVNVPAHTAVTMDVGPLQPPSPATLRVSFAGKTDRWQFPLQAGPADPEGPVTVIAVGRNGGSPVVPIALRPDPGVDASPARAAIAGRAALAALKAAPGDADLLAAVDAAVARVWAHGPYAAEQAALVTLFLAEFHAARPGTVSRSELEGFARTIGAPASSEVRAWAVRARRAAGLPIDDNVIAVLRRDAAKEDASDAVLLALPTPGRQAAVLQQAAPPDPGDPLLPDWIAAHAVPPGKQISGSVTITSGELRQEIPLATGGLVVMPGPATIDGPALSWRAAGPPTGSIAPLVLRLPAGTDDRALEDTGEAAVCDPCRLTVGDFLVVTPAPPVRDVLPRTGGLVRQWKAPGVPVLRATVPGSFIVAGLSSPTGEGLAAPMQVEVLAAPEPGLLPGVAMAAAGRELDAGLAPNLPLGTLSDTLEARRAELAYTAALRADDDAAIAQAFRLHAATSPAADLDFDAVIRTATALRAVGDHVGALRLWRAGLDAAFAAEAAGIGRIEHQTGLLAAIQRVREAAGRYPDGPFTGEALYLLPARLLQAAHDGLPFEVEAAGITATDVRLTAAAWDREFLSTYPKHARATASGLRLSRTLLALGAASTAAEWSARVAKANPDAPLIDGLVYLEALARTEASQPEAAEALLRRLLHAPFPDANGLPAPSEHLRDAQLVLGRLYESRGQIDRALDAYAAASPSQEAERATIALKRTALSTEKVRRLTGTEPARLTLEATNVEEVRIRAYQVDLRTLFLRDGGLSFAHNVAVAGVSPSWSGTRHVGAGPFPSSHDITLPLSGPGAWLVQLESGGATQSVLVVRSDLTLSATDTNSGRRVALRLRGKPKGGVEVRALAGGEVVPVVTDVRGVADVPQGANVLAWSDGHVAFTDPSITPSGTPTAAPGGERGLTPLLEGLDRRVDGLRTEDAQAWDARFERAAPRMSLEAL